MSRRFLESWPPAVAGLVAVFAGMGAAELTAAILSPTGSPLLVVGSLVIDLVPGWVKDVVISLFGTADKAVLLIALGILVAILAAAAGILEKWRPPAGRILVVVIGAVGVLGAITRSNAGALDAAPPLVAIVVAAIVLSWLITRLRPARSPVPSARDRTATDTAADAATNDPVGRRRFLLSAGVSASAGLLAVLGGRMLTAGRQATQTVRSLFTLPSPAVAAAPVSDAAALDVPGISPLVTANADFYRIDTALQVPVIDPKAWSLTITGMVDRQVSVSFDELVALPLEESYATLMCVSNHVGGDLIGNAKWLGYPIRELLKRAGPQAGADMVLSRSIDGFTASSPLSALTDDRNAILAVGMNGQPLPFEHGYPVRIVVPGLYGYVSATKWVVELEVTTFAKRTAYWTNRGWSARGPIKTSSRIDVPKAPGGALSAGTVAVAGVAWAQHVGISGVQVQVDGGAWNDAELAEAISADTWRQWLWRWPAKAGKHVLTVRAIDATGAVQTSAAADVVPDGATGLHSITVNVS
ncbi:MAG: molybdopterin-dependent oxidoreductase [Lacisediminihabitans sp.]